MRKAKPPQVRPSNNEIRHLMLQYFYDRNRNATSARGKKGSAVKISDVKKELKAAHGLTQQEVQSNLTYLISQGWVEESTVEKTFTAPAGTVIPSSTSYYRITAAGIDKIEGPGEFTMLLFRPFPDVGRANGVHRPVVGLAVRDERSDADDRVVDVLRKFFADRLADLHVRLADKVVGGREPG
jgi:hypothetical protein